MKKKINKRKIIEEWIKNNGGADFDLKEEEIILFDGGIFPVCVETKIKPKTRLFWGKKHENGCREIKFIPIKRNGKILKEKVDEYKVIIWFPELGETILYLQRMDKMLKKLGYDTHKSVNWKRKIFKKNVRNKKK